MCRIGACRVAPAVQRARDEAAEQPGARRVHERRPGLADVRLHERGSRADQGADEGSDEAGAHRTEREHGEGPDLGLCLSLRLTHAT